MLMMTSREVSQVSFWEIWQLCKKHTLLFATASITGIGILALRRYFTGGVCTSTARLDGRVVIITGANTGIGKETAKNLASRGAKVILACRDITKAERAAAEIRRDTNNQQVLVRLVDLASQESIRRFCRHIQRTEEKLHILINNAGVMWCPQWKSAEGYNLQLAVNHLGHFLLTNLLIDLLKKSAPSRIINVSALKHEEGKIRLDDLNMEKNYDPFAAYCQSKLANILFTRELGKRLQGHGVSVFALHPGAVKTDLLRYIPIVGIPKWKQWLWKPIMYFAFKTAEQGAQTSVYCAVTEGIEQHSGKYFSDCRLREPAPQAQDDEVAEKLWDLSTRMVKLSTSPLR